MKKALYTIVVTLALVSSYCFLNEDNYGGVMPFKGWENPETKFDVTKNEISQVHLKWVIASDINAACSRESVKRGGKVFRFDVQACSFWEGKECVIMTPKMASIHNLGHEVLHCFRGAYH